MPLGIDVGTRTIHVATSQGTTRHGNAIRKSTNDEADKAIQVEIDDGIYIVGADDAEEGGGEPIGRLFGEHAETSSAVQKPAAEAYLMAVGEGEETGNLQYVTRGDGADPLETVAVDLGYDTAELDPGMAVCYDAFDTPATGLGIAVTEEQAFATLAAAGVPVATTTLNIAEDWFDFKENTAGISDGPTGDWLARQYEGLFADLAASLARSSPALNGPLSVAVGGEAAPADVTAELADVLGSMLPFEIESVTVADDPSASLARGALAAAEADDGPEAPLPVFAASVPFVGALADFQTAVEMLDVSARQTVRVDATGDGTASNDGVDVQESSDSEGVVTRAQTDLETLDRRGAMTAQGVSDLAARLSESGSGDVESLRAEFKSLESRLPDTATIESLERDLSDELDALREAIETIEADLEALDAETVSVDTVRDLEASLDSLESAVEDLERDTEKIRAAVTGLDADTELDASEATGEAIDTLRAEALQDDIEDIETDLSNRIEALWSELDELEDRLVDLEGIAGVIPDLETSVASAQDTVTDLEDETEELRETIDSLREDIESVGNETPSVADLRAIESDLDGLAADVKSLREEIDAADWVDPATVDKIESDLDALRQTLIARADRLETLEETVENLRERIETVYQNSAKSEALSSLETETARVRQTAAEAMERTNEMVETVGELGETVDTHDEQLGMLSTNVDNLAGSAVTRSEMEAAIDGVDDRLAEMESEIRSELETVRTLAEETEPDLKPVEEEDNQDLVVVLQTVAFVALGFFGALLAIQGGSILVAGGFLVFSIMPGVLSWLIS